MILRFDLFLCHHDKHQVGDTAGAIQHYELAGTHCVEVPRMLFERGRVEDLEEYITQVPFVRPCLVSFPRNNPLIPSANKCVHPNDFSSCAEGNNLRFSY